FADIFQQGNRWLNWLEKQPEGSVRPVVIESVTKIMACGTTLMGYTQWCCSSPDCSHIKKICFRCKSRSCPHCGVKAGAQWIQYLLSLVPDCPWQHIVFTLPCQYWSLVFHNRWLLAEMSRIAADVIQEICRQADVVPGIFTVIHTWGRDQQWHPHIHLSTTTGGVTSDHTWKNLHFYARKVMSMWRYRITRLLSRKYPDLVIPDALAAEGSSKRDWNRFLDSHYRRGWNVNVSRVMDNATHVAVYFGSYLKKPPVPMSRLEHYAGQDEIGLRYNSHRTKREEYLVMSGDEFMERFSWHVADKGFRMVRYYGFLSPVKRRLLEDVVYVITETVRKTAMQIRWRGMYQ
ncbi:IS91 family transposase, partial [Escherichia coli]|nr:IS91 family transposase [Escherichia coli]